MEQTHHIIFVAESSTALPTFVAVYSLRTHCHCTQKYHVHILSIGLSVEQECALQALSAEAFTVQVYAVDSEKEETAPQDVAGILTLQLANIFWELSTALYLDAHVIIQKDIQTLFTVQGQKEEGLAYVAFAPEDMGMEQSKVMLLYLETLREHKVVAELMACNVPKGDYAGYGRALRKVLGKQSVCLPKGAVALESGQDLEFVEGDEQKACICICSSASKAHTEQESLWHRYNTKARADFAPMHAVFTLS